MRSYGWIICYYEHVVILMYLHRYLYNRKLFIQTIQIREVQQISNILQMEEFYRKKYLSPSYNRGVSAYLQTLEKDKTITELRKQLHEVKQMEEKFDQLCLEIVRVQKQNKKLQSQQSQIEGQYLEKIKRNKAKITDLKQNLLDCKEVMESKTAKITVLEAQSQQLLCQLQRIKKESQQTLEQRQRIELGMQMQEKLMEEIKKKIQLQKQSSLQMKKYNEMKSSQLSKSYEQFKKKHVELKKQEIQCSSKQEEHEKLAQQKQDLIKIVQINKMKMQQTKWRLQLEQKQCNQLQSTYKTLDWQKQKENVLWHTTWKEVKQNVCKAKEWSLKIKSNQSTLSDSLKSLQKDKMYLQKLTVKQIELKKNNEKLQQSVKHWSQILSQEQSTYSRIVSQMKMSIVQDQKAIESLSKQATLLETMIN